MRFLSLCLIGMLSWSLVLSPGTAPAQRDGAPEKPKEMGTPADLERFLAELNTLTKQYFLDGMRLEEARREAFQHWAREHHADPLGSGPKHGFIHNKELPSNLGVVDMDWLATMGNLGLPGPLGAAAYLGGKTVWFLRRSKEQPPDLSTFFNTYPDTNWRALAIAELLSSGKVAPEEIFRPGRASKRVQDKRASLDALFQAGQNLGFKRGGRDHLRSRNAWTGFAAPVPPAVGPPVRGDRRGGIDAGIDIKPEDFQAGGKP